MTKEEQQAFEAGKKAIKRLLIEEKRMKAKLERIQKENQELKKQLHDASIQIQELIEKDIWCPSNCEKLEKLQRENKKIKKQLEECYCNRTDCSSRIKNSKKYDSLVQAQEAQQKKFINYLEDKIYSIEPKGTGINYNCEYDSEEDYVMAMQEQSRLNTLKEILQKYKSIIGGR